MKNKRVGVLAIAIGLSVATYPFISAQANETIPDETVYTAECKNNLVVNPDGSQYKDESGETLFCGTPKTDNTKSSQKLDMTGQEKDSGLISHTGEDLGETTTKVTSKAMSLWLTLQTDNDVPTFTLEVSNLTTKETKKVTFNSAVYKNGMYKVTVPDLTYSTGNKMQVKVNGKPDTISSVNLSIGANNFSLTNSKPSAYFTAKVYGKETDDGKSIKALVGEASLPLVGNVTYAKDYVRYQVNGENGKGLQETSVIITNKDSLAEVTLVTDTKGLLIIPKEFVDGTYTVKPKAYEGVVERPVFTDDGFGNSIKYDVPPERETNFKKDTSGVSEVVDGGARETTDIAEEEMETGGTLDEEGLFTVKINTKERTDLSAGWVDFNVTFKDGKSDVHVDQNTEVIALSGKEIDSIVSEHAEVSHKIKGKTITFDVAPKYTFEIYNEGKAYDVTVINTDPQLDFKGKTRLVFGIKADETFQLKNNKTGAVTTLSASSDSKTMGYNSDYGQVKGGAMSNPHTNTWLYVTLLALIFSILVLLILLEVKYKKISKNFKKIVSLFAIGILSVSLLPPNIKASVVTDGSSGGGSSPTAGLPTNILNFHSDIAIMEVYFVDVGAAGGGFHSSQNDVSKYSNKIKYNFDSRKYAVYFTTDGKAYNAADKADSGVVAFDETAANPNERFKTLNGVNAIINNLRGIGASNANALVETGSQAKASLESRLISPSKTVSDSVYTGEGAVFINAIQNGIRKAVSRTSSSVRYPLSNAVGETTFDYEPYGSVVGGNLRTNHLDASGTKATKLFESYVEYLDANNMAKADSSYITSLRTAFQKGEAIMMINTLLGVSPSTNASTNAFGFMSLSDTVAWYDYVRKSAGFDDGVSRLKEHHAMDNFGRPAMSSGGKPNQGTAYKSNGNIEWTFYRWAKDYYAHTIQPSNGVNLPSSLSSGTNPFGGWGFMHFGILPLSAEPEKVPRITVKLTVTIEEEKIIDTTKPDEKTIETKKVYDDFLKDWKPTDAVTLKSLTESYNNFINLPSKYTSGGLDYIVDDQSKLEISMIDKPSATNACPINENEELVNKVDYLTKGTGVKFTGKAEDLILDDKINIEELTVLKRLLTYVGGTESDTYTHNGTVLAKNKYAHTPDGETCYGNVEMHINIVTTNTEVEEDEPEEKNPEVTPEKHENSVDISLKVPQWSFSEYFPSVITAEKGKTYFKYNFPKTKHAYRSYDDWRSTLKQGSYVDLTMNYKTPLEGNNLWLLYETGFVKDSDKYNLYQNEINSLDVTNHGENDEGLMELGFDGVQELQTDAHLTAVRTTTEADVDGVEATNSNGTVDSIMLPKWTNTTPSNPLFNGRITIAVEPKGSGKKTTSTSKTVTYVADKKLWNDTNHRYTMQYYKDWGKKRGWRPKTPSTHKHTLEESRVTVSLPITYDKYIQKTGSMPVALNPNQFKHVYRFAQHTLTKDSRKFNFYPEVMMKVEQQDSSEKEKSKVSAVNALGERQREIKPYVNSIIELQATTATPKLKTVVTGAEASDSRAVGLAKAISQNNSNTLKPVLNKGANTSNAMEFQDSVLVNTVYAWEFKDKALGEKWNGSLANTDAVVKNYRDAFVKANGDIAAKTEPYYFIGNKKLEVAKTNINFKLNNTKVTKYPVEVRGGVISLVGNTETGVYTYEDLKGYTADSCKVTKVVQKDIKKEIACTLLHTTALSETGLMAEMERKVGHKITSEGENTRFVSLSNQLRNLDNRPAVKFLTQEVGKEWYYEDTTVFNLARYQYTYSIPAILWNTKLPMKFEHIPNLKTPTDKNQFYSKGIIGHVGSIIRIGQGETKVFETDISSHMLNNENLGLKSTSKYDYIVPNVSVSDSFQ